MATVSIKGTGIPVEVIILDRTAGTQEIARLTPKGRQSVDVSETMMISVRELNAAEIEAEAEFERAKVEAEAVAAEVAESLRVEAEEAERRRADRDVADEDEEEF
jgi:predicted short-subunit dehydrogenase-like oxidoreductase (DUF2520 family)